LQRGGGGRPTGRLNIGLRAHRYWRTNASGGTCRDGTYRSDQTAHNNPKTLSLWS
jgi:hypothetical protein